MLTVADTFYLINREVMIKIKDRLEHFKTRLSGPGLKCGALWVAHFQKVLSADLKTECV